MRYGFHSRSGTAIPSGHVLPWTLGILAMAAMAQLGLFVALQSRNPATPKEGTAEENHQRAVTVAAPAQSSPNPPRAEDVLPDSLPPVIEEPATPAVATTSPPPLVARPELASPAPGPGTAGTDSINEPDPSVLPDDASRMLVAEAVRLRRTGDMAGAVGKLNAALDKLPGHPRLMFEMAATYEAMGMTDRAVEAYGNVASMGHARAGALHPIAERRLKDGLKGPGNQAGTDDLLFLGGVEEIRQPDGDRNLLRLRVDIHVRPGNVIEPSKVSLPVRFFDRLDGKSTVPSLADPPAVAWITQPVDWKEPGVETVEITCQLPPEDENSPGAGRKYLGYLVELYYQDALVDVLARPRRLARHQDPTPEPMVDLPESLPETLGGPLLGP